MLTTKFSKKAQKAQRIMSELEFVGLKDFGIFSFSGLKPTPFSMLYLDLKVEVNNLLFAI